MSSRTGKDKAITSLPPVAVRGISAGSMKHFKTWSSAFFAVPLFIAIYFHVWLTVALLVAVIVASTLYHLSKEERYKQIDIVFAWSLILSNFLICYLGSFTLPYAAITFLLVIPAFYAYDKQKYNYDLNHGLWHLFSSLITIFSILTFAL